MKLLMIGGTEFIGRHIVLEAVARGHEVTVLHRGHREPADLPPVRHVHADRNHAHDGGLAVLTDGDQGGERWDATIDTCAYLPRQVRSLGDVLAGPAGDPGRGGRYVLISSISAYADPPAAGITEDAPLATLPDDSVEEVTGETYGGLKALCERAAVQTFGPGTLVVRPTYVIGPHDPTGRFTHWVRRLARGGRVPVAGPPEQPVQTVDVRDLAALVVTLVEAGHSGPVHVAAPSPGPAPFTLRDLLEQVRGAVAPEGTTLDWVDPTAAHAAGLDGRSLPLWHEGEIAWVGAVDPGLALRLGLRARPVADTARDVLDHPGTPLVAGVGPTAEQEAALLAAVDRRT